MITLMMKYRIITLVLIIGITACQQDVWPEDLKDKQALLNEKKAEIRSLESDVKKLKGEIEDLKPQKDKKRRLVSTKLIEKKDFQKFLNAQGSIIAENVVKVSSDMGGRLVNIYAKEGDYVKRGKLLARVDLESFEKQGAELEKSLELAKTAYERQKRLWDQNIGSEMQYLQAKNNKERLEKSLESVSYQSSRANVYAPMSGYIDREFMQTGEIAAPGMPILQILNSNKLKAVADLPEQYLGKIKKGDQVEMMIPALDKKISGRVSLLGRSIDPANRTFKTEVSIANKGGILKPNLLVEMLLNDYTQQDAIVVPLSLVQDEIGGRKFVFVSETGIDGPMAVKKYVTPGESYDAEVIILEGLTGNETLIVDGARNLVERELITIENSKEGV